ncbi:hypothetical protein BJY52DRAFT_1428160 [Lactarius psammicola]|nr:hypothetical protein BJY52DRAFT_1428160 [Lactarius psammicola]
MAPLSATRPPPPRDFTFAAPRSGRLPTNGRPTNELLGSPPFKPQKFHCYEVTLMVAASLDVNFKEELGFKVLSEAERTDDLYSLLQHSTQVQIRFFIPVLQQIAIANPMTTLLSPALGGSVQSQMEAMLSNMSGPPFACTFNTSANPNRQSLAFDLTSSFLSPDTANTVGNPSNTATTLAQQCTKLKAIGKAAHRISARALASSRERGTWTSVLGQVAERDNSPHKRYSLSLGHPVHRAPTSLASPPALLSALRAPMEVPLPALNDWYGGGGNIPRLDGPDKFRRPFTECHVRDSSSGSTAVNNGMPNNGVYGGDGDLISSQGHHALGVGRVQSNSLRGLRNGGGGTWSGASNDGSNTIAAAHQQAALAGLGMGVGSFNLRLGSPGLAGMPNGLSMAQLAQMNGMNPFGVGVNMLGMANLSTMRITPEAQLLAAHIAAAGGGFGLDVVGAKKDEEDFDLAVLHDVAWWLRTLRLHKEMVVIDEQAPEAQGVAALGARRKLLKTFEVVRRKTDIDDPTAPPPPGSLSSGGPAPVTPNSNMGSSAGSGGGLSA